MYQLLLCANSTLITFGQLSFLNSDSTSCKVKRMISLLNTQTPPKHIHQQVVFTSTGVVSGTSLRMIIHRLWLGRTFSPFSSTCTIGEAEGKKTHLYLDMPQMYADSFQTRTTCSTALTSQHIQDEVHVSGENLNTLHAGYRPDGDKLVTVHLGHQVQIL